MRSLVPFTRRSWSRWLFVVAILFVVAGAAPVQALINTENSSHNETEDFRGDFRYYSNRGNFDAAIRMAIATFEGVTYYAFVNHDGNGIRIIPEGGARDEPSRNPDLACDVAVRRSNEVPREYLTGNAIVVDLVPRDGLLYLICRGGPGRIYVQALKTKLGTRRLVAAGSLYQIGSPFDGNGAYCAAAGAVSGNEGLYVHGLWAQGNDLKMITYLLKPNADDFERVISKNDIPAAARGFMVNASDAAGTHELNAAGQLEEVHYFTWGAGNDHIWLTRFLPATADRAATYDFVQDSGIQKMDSRRNASTLTLMEGGMNGDTTSQYSLSLIEFATNIGAAGERSDGIVSKLQHHSLSTAEHRYVGDWTGTDFSFEQTASNRYLAYFSTTHWGIDKTRIAPGNGPDPKPDVDRGPYDSSFMSSMQQRFRFSIMAFYTKQQFVSNYDYTSFHTAEVRGNNFITDPRDPNQKAITALDTSQALVGDDRSPLFHSWTLIGVIHGVPPYLPYRKGDGYPSLKFTFAKTASTEFSFSDSTEDSKEVTVAVSLGGGAIDRGAGKATGLFSVSGSYSYGVTTVNGSTTTNTKTRSVQTSQTFEPDDQGSSFPPDQIGVLLYSAPIFVSKGYSVRRWNCEPFSDTGRNVYQTVVARRELQTLYYLLDAPHLGPLMGTDLQPSAAFAPLTAGIPPVDRTSNFPRWRTPNLQRDIDSYDQFSAAGTTASFTASYFSAGAFSLDYTETDSQSKTQSLTKTHKGTVSVAGGLDGIFNINVSGSISKSNTFSTTSTASTSVGQGISGEFPKLPRTEGQPINEITARAYLLYSKDSSPPEWTPAALRGASSPFLLTWTARVRPAAAGRKRFGPLKSDD